MRFASKPGLVTRAKGHSLRPRRTYRMAGAWLGGLLVAWLLGVGCGRSGDDFTTPGATLRTYRAAVERGNTEEIWSCYSKGYQGQVTGGYAAWSEGWRRQAQAEARAEVERPVEVERAINDRIAFILFRGSDNQSPQASPFFYFVREPDGWKITSHLDSTFHRELERAIERGEFKLPEL